MEKLKYSNKIMAATIKNFSFLIKKRSLFYELIDELTLNKDKDIDAIICHIVKMFGGALIRIPSINEIKLFYHLIDNVEKYKYLFDKHNSARALVGKLQKAIMTNYDGPLHDVEITQIIIGFIDSVTDLDYETEAAKHHQVTMAKRKADTKIKQTYNAEVYLSENDVPEDDEKNEQ